MRTAMEADATPFKVAASCSPRGAHAQPTESEDAMRTSMGADAAPRKAVASRSPGGGRAHLTAVELRGQMKTPPRSLDNGTPPVSRESTQEPPITTAGLASLNSWGAGGVDLCDANLPKNPSFCDDILSVVVHWNVGAGRVDLCGVRLAKNPSLRRHPFCRGPLEGEQAGGTHLRRCRSQARRAIGILQQAQRARRQATQKKNIRASPTLCPL